ncbi:MAG: hypothetical protein Q8R13_05910 [bacterium]|nr:hypothetical protein [bacterium]MDZ4296174.1 hypothetical protein [Patescibacteria group bacterium]
MRLAVLTFFTFLMIYPLAGTAQTGPLIQSLEWEAQSAVPDEYRGRALPSPGTTVRVSLVLTPGVNPEDVAVSWEVDQKPVGTRDPHLLAFPAVSAPGTAHLVTARVRNRKTDALDDARVSIPVAARELNLHRLSASGTVIPYSSAPRPSMTGGATLSLVARPYFFPLGGVAYRWNVDNRDIAGTPRTPHLLTLATPTAPPAPVRTQIRATAIHPLYNEMRVDRELVVEIR